MTTLSLTPSRFDPSIGARVVPKLSKKQQELLAAVLIAAACGVKKLLVIGCLGEWGGGKSMIAMILFLALCILNSDPTQTDPDMLPCSGIWAKTEDDVKRSTVAELLQIVPPELIRERTDEYILWEFGHKTWLYSASKSAEGASLTHALVDEIQDQKYRKVFGNIKARPRADRAKLRALICVGLSERGPVEDIFRTPEEDEGQIIFYRMMYPEENPGMPPGYALSLRAGQAGSKRKRDKQGWLIATGVMYPTFSTEDNIDRARERWPDRAALTDLPISIGIDQGQWASAVIGVDVPIEVLVPDPKKNVLVLKQATGLLLIDQVVIDNCGEGQLAIAVAERIREMDYCVKAGVSILAADPTLLPQQMDSWRAAIPGLVHVQIKEGPYKLEKNGRAAVDWAIRDGVDQVRLFVHPKLIGANARGVPESLRGYRADKPRDKFFEHTADAVRYLVQVKLPLPDLLIPKKGIKITAPSAQVRDRFWEG